MRLYELPKAWDEIQSAIAEADGEMPPMVESLLETFEEDLNRKVEGCVKLIRNWEAEQEVAKKEAFRLSQLAANRARNVERLKAYLLATLQRMGIDQAGTDHHRDRVVKSSRPSLEWTRTLDEVPLPFRKLVPFCDTQKAYEVWKETGTLPEGFKVTQGYHLRIN